MSRRSLVGDIGHLAGRLPHRGSSTDEERAAAEYLLRRFQESTSHAAIEEFSTFDTHFYLFAMYYGEFLVVTLVAIWSPWAALAYGTVVFLMYLAEFTGYSVASRFLPQFATQNVVAHFPQPESKRLLIVTANYDSPRETVLAQAQESGRLRWLHLGIVLSMVALLAACGADGLGVFDGYALRIGSLVRWVSVSVLTGVGFVLFFSERAGEFTPGANNNASGASVLIELAERLKARPVADTEVWLVATGSGEVWRSGMRYFLRSLEVDRGRTYFLNVSSVGGGTLRYTTGEGMMHVFRMSKEWRAIAEREAGRFDATPLVYRGLPTDALLPLARGFKTLGVMGAGRRGEPLRWGREDDTVGMLDLDQVERSSDFVEALVRALDASS